MDHGDDLIILFNSQQHIIQIPQWLPNEDISNSSTCFRKKLPSYSGLISKIIFTLPWRSNSRSKIQWNWLKNFHYYLFSPAQFPKTSLQSISIRGFDRYGRFSRFGRFSTIFYLLISAFHGIFNKIQLMIVDISTIIWNWFFNVFESSLDSTQHIGNQLIKFSKIFNSFW